LATAHSALKYVLFKIILHFIKFAIVSVSYTCLQTGDVFTTSIHAGLSFLSTSSKDISSTSSNL